MQVVKWAIAAVLCVGGASAQGDIIYDTSPGTNTASIGGALNGTGQHFFEPVSFSQDATVTGMAIYTNPTIASVTSADIEIDSNGSGNTPGGALFTEIDPVSEDSLGTRSGIDNSRAYVTFQAPFIMNAGQTYWFSMEGHYGNLNCYLYEGYDDPYGFQGYEISSTGYGFSNAGDVSMQLYGTVVPEPGTLALMTVFSTTLLYRRR